MIQRELALIFQLIIESKKIYTMTEIEFTIHLNRISDLIQETIFYTDSITENDFRRNEDLKERVYFMLQEIGQIANEIVAYGEAEEKRAIPASILSSLKTAHYNLHVELNDQNVFNIVKNDLPKIQKEIRETIQNRVQNYTR